MISLVFAAALLAGAADPAQAASQTAANSPTTATTTKAADKPGKSEMVCKKEAVLGSRMKQRVCMTQADWDQRRLDSRDEVEKNQSTKPMSF